LTAYTIKCPNAGPRALAYVTRRSSRFNRHTVGERVKADASFAACLNLP
jgi:hypothetical protein